MDGHGPFHDAAIANKVFPLFNIEFMALLEDEQSRGIRVNDPNNPGRTYFSGKGLDYPSRAGSMILDQLRKVKDESNRQTEEMVMKISKWLEELEMPFTVGFEEIKRSFAQDLVRERHLAKAIRHAVYGHFSNETARKEALEKICGGKLLKSAINDHAGVENELRSNLLKKGGVAFVEEDPEAFLQLDVVMEIVRALGGIPCYPVLLDDPQGNTTEYESDPAKLYSALTSRDIYSLELIPGRNDHDILKEFVKYFDERNFLITFGTEHNTPALDPLTVSCRGGVPLDAELQSISNKGCSVIAAHQYLRAKGFEGYLTADGVPKTKQFDHFVKLGNAVMDYFFNH